MPLGNSCKWHAHNCRYIGGQIVWLFCTVGYAVIIHAFTHILGSKCVLAVDTRHTTVVVCSFEHKLRTTHVSIQIHRYT